MCDLLIDIVCMNCASQRMIRSHETLFFFFFALSSSFVEELVMVSKYWSFYMLEMLWCAQEPWYPYIKGNCSQITFYCIVLTIIIKQNRQLVACMNLLHIVV